MSLNGEEMRVLLSFSKTPYNELLNNGIVQALHGNDSPESTWRLLCEFLITVFFRKTKSKNVQPTEI